jgi:hypothetical protein
LIGGLAGFGFDDHPRIPAKKLQEVRRLYPEFYDHLIYYDDYFVPLKDYLRRKGAGFRYGGCA